uniref:CX domain-containing protein n=1 Tax=Caenorhabditis tropicalis TaxID=1561998 RepID=A0A1I7U3F7_9PELO
MLPFGFLLRRLLGRRRRRNQNYSEDVTYRTVYVMNGGQPHPGSNDPPPAYYPQDPAIQYAYYPPEKGCRRRRRCR